MFRKVRKPCGSVRLAVGLLCRSLPGVWSVVLPAFRAFLSVTQGPRVSVSSVDLVALWAGACLEACMNHLHWRLDLVLQLKVLPLALPRRSHGYRRHSVVVR